VNGDDDAKSLLDNPFRLPGSIEAVQISYRDGVRPRSELAAIYSWSQRRTFRSEEEQEYLDQEDDEADGATD
jgi:hypothetical protein